MLSAVVDRADATTTTTTTTTTTIDSDCSKKKFFLRDNVITHVICLVTLGDDVIKNSEAWICFFSIRSAFCL